MKSDSILQGSGLDIYKFRFTQVDDNVLNINSEIKSVSKIYLRYFHLRDTTHQYFLSAVNWQINTKWYGFTG